MELISFNAVIEGNGVRLSWETTSAIDNLGFNLYRAEALDGERIKINSDLIQSQVYPGSITGVSYSYLDTGVDTNRVHYHWLEEVDIHGRIETYLLKVPAISADNGKQHVLLPIILKVP